MSEFSTFLQLTLRSLETGSVYALMALSIIIIFRTSLTLHFAQGTMAMFCTFCIAFLVNSYNLPLWLALVCGIIIAAIMATLVDFLVIRRTNAASVDGRKIITLGLIMVFIGLAPMIFGSNVQNLPRFIPRGDLSIAGASISYNAILNIASGLALMGVLFFILQYTKFGLAIRATASNEVTARLMGVQTKLVTLVAWIVAGILGVVAGVMIAPATTVNVGLMAPIQLAALLACVLGGFQTFYGPVIGAYIIGMLPNYLSYYGSSVWSIQIMYLLILLFLLIRPNGIIGKKFIKKV
ncbi:MAG: branched-chain amino acid ABC transporter permease [Oscillospiraceae bacterium]|jgi:branched-chain amino acid transport system permease protein|nr:branched-chain amino acid ABC transporter permease [Oscillospiraceae bacterium]